ARDVDPRVRFRVALAWGGRVGSDAVAALATAALADSDSWTADAIAASLPENASQLLARIYGSPVAPQHAAKRLKLSRQFATVIGARGKGQEVAGALRAACPRILEAPPPVARAALLGIAQGMERRGRRLADFIDSTSEVNAELRADFSSTIERAARGAA